MYDMSLHYNWQNGTAVMNLIEGNERIDRAEIGYDFVDDTVLELVNGWGQVDEVEKNSMMTVWVEEDDTIAIQICGWNKWERDSLRANEHDWEELVAAWYDMMEPVLLN